MEKRHDLESCLKKVEEILKRIRMAKKEEEIQKVLPSWGLLNRLHSAVSSLLDYHR